MTPNTDNPGNEEIQQSAETQPGSSQGAPGQKEKWWKVFIPTKEFLFTPLIIDINVVLFLLMVATSGDFQSFMTPGTDTMLKWGATEKILILQQHEWWRLITSVFGHFGIIHLAFNMYALLSIGVYLEPLLGKARYISAYLATGIIANLASLWWHNNSVGAGASGAIFGLYGVFFALLTTNLIEASVRMPLLKSIGIFIVYNLIFGASVGVVDNAAHIGGLISGVLIGYIIFFSLQMPALKNGLVIAGITILLSVAAAYITLPRLKMPTDLAAEYDRIMKDFSAHEAKALNVYTLPKTTPDEELLKLYQNEALPNWNNCKEDIKRLDSFDFPPAFKPIKERLNRYVDYRTQIVQLDMLRLKERSTKYDAQIDELRKKVDDLLKESDGGSSK